MRRLVGRHGPSGGSGSEHGWAEVVVLLLFSTVIGLAFLWALVLHEKPRDEKRAKVDRPATTTATLTPPTLPPPRKYKVEGGVNVRQGPGTNTSVLMQVEDGKTVLVQCRTEGQDVTTSLGSTDQWLRISVNESSVGYVSALYVETGDDLDDPRRIAPCI